jgi:chromosome transmission fidelity protein 8
MASTSVTLTKPDLSSHPPPNGFPQLLQTPTGLALLELQGTINLPDTSEAVDIGRIDFPDYCDDALDPSGTAWMKRVYLYVGEHQRLTGDVRKLPRPVAVIRRKGAEGGGEREGDGEAEELEVVEIVKYKLVFDSRPEPVTSVVID